jgi:hypothetical protein
MSCVIACGSSNNAPTVDTNKSNICSQVAAVDCYDIYQCCSESEIEKDLGLTTPESQDQCGSDLTKLCERDLVTFESSLAANRVTFDATALNACLKALEAPANECATVDTMLPWADACMTSAWIGNVADGSQCFYSFECKGTGPGTSFCSPNETCMPLPTAGQACTAEGCAKGNYCNFTGPTATCVPLQATGGTCTNTAECMMGLYCNFTTGPATCQPLLAGGQACTNNNSCESNQCLPGTCSTDPAQQCFTKDVCNGMCTTGPNTGNFCTTDTNCGGHCSTTTTTACIVAGSCPAGETCVLYTCNPPTCDGDIVCASSQLTVDYCTGPNGALTTVLGF